MKVKHTEHEAGFKDVFEVDMYRATVFFFLTNYDFKRLSASLVQITKAYQPQTQDLTVKKKKLK